MARESRRTRWSAAALIASVVVTIGWAAHAAPSAGHTRPTDPREVVAKLPARRSVQAARLEALRARTRARPDDLGAAVALARAQIELSRVDGDPRPLGYAEETLRPWLTRPEPDAAVLVLAGTIAQSRHEFERALAWLDRALVSAPDDAQVWLTRASILAVTGEYVEAARACDALAPLVTPLVAHACSAPLRGLRGDAPGASAELESALTGAGSDGERAWLRSLLAELAYWTGDAKRAAKEARAALTLDPSDRYTRALLADLLLDQGEPAEVRALVKAHTGDDALLLRDALAAQRLQATDAPELLTRVRQRTAQNRLRGDLSHQREEARLLLATPGAEADALAAAAANFRVQKEPWDVRVLLEAAHAAHDRASAEPALAWLNDTGFASPALRARAARFGGQP